MSTEQEHYLKCDKCGEAYADDTGRVIRGETEDCVRAEAEDDGWLCYQGGKEDQDYCPEHKPN